MNCNIHCNEIVDQKQNIPYKFKKSAPKYNGTKTSATTIYYLKNVIIVTIFALLSLTMVSKMNT